MLDDGNDFFFRQSGVKKDRSTAFGKALVATATPQQTGVVGTVSVPNTDIFFAPKTEFGAVFIRATKLVEVVCDRV
jgi:hypothetical protein